MKKYAPILSTRGDSEVKRATLKAAMIRKTPSVA